MPDFGSSFSLPSLLCHENESCCFNENVCVDDDPCLVLDIYEVEYIEKLIERENGFDSRSFESFFDDECSKINGGTWLRCARMDAIQWILNTRAVFGFQFHTAYLSVTYFDRFLSKRIIDDGKFWAIRLLSVACLSIAAKMEECKVPSLSEYPLKDYCFENKVILRMELLVLDTLDWKMGSVTPFLYIHYFINNIYVGDSRPRDIFSKVVELIMEITKEINSQDYQPSVIAAAAVFAASNVHLTRKELEIKLNTISSGSSLENEHILSCYITLQEIEMRKIKTPKQTISPNSSSLHSSAIDVLDNPSFISGAGSKRRLTFRESEQNCSAKKICRP